MQNEARSTTAGTTTNAETMGEGRRGIPAGFGTGGVERIPAGGRATDRVIVFFAKKRGDRIGARAENGVTGGDKGNCALYENGLAVCPGPGEKIQSAM